MPEKLRYPIGKAKIPSNITQNDIQRWISIIEDHPKKLSTLVINLTEAQLDTPYRPNGWTIRQVIHHLGDSHTNSYMRFKGHLPKTNQSLKPITKIVGQN